MKRFTLLLLVLCFLTKIELNAQVIVNDTDSLKQRYKETIKQVFNVNIDTVSNPGTANWYAAQVGAMRMSNNSDLVKISNDTILFGFYLRGTEIKLEDNIDFFYVHGSGKKKEIIKLHTVKDFFVLPNVNKKSTGSLFIKYKNLVYLVGTLDFETWKANDVIFFVYDVKPYFKNCASYNLANKQYAINVHVNQPNESMDAQKEDIKACSYTIFERLASEQTSYISKEEDYFRENEERIKGK